MENRRGIAGTVLVHKIAGMCVYAESVWVSVCILVSTSHKITFFYLSCNCVSSNFL